MVLYRGRELRRFQYYKTADWPGGLYLTPTFAGSRPGALSATCWAALLSMGSPGVAGRLLLLVEDRMELQLPTSFPAGPAEALLYVMYEGMPVLSNAVPLQIPENSP